jgi:nitrite reductase (NADH) small subunit
MSNTQVKERWIDICKIDQIPSMSGVCALHQGQQVALFNLSNNLDKPLIKSISNIDPIGNASVLSRGLLAEINGRQVVASPLHKQHYCLDTGECLQHQEIRIRTFRTRLKEKNVQLEVLLN